MAQIYLGFSASPQPICLMAIMHGYRNVEKWLLQPVAKIQYAYADFSPNASKLLLSGESSKNSHKRTTELHSDSMNEESFAYNKNQRLAQLPPLLIEIGPYCKFLREARDVFVDGHFYACVAMYGISFERFQRDKAKPYGATGKHNMPEIRQILQDNKVLMDETLALCNEMSKLRNVYAHGDGAKPEEDAFKSLSWMHSFIDNETNLMRDYVIKDGILCRGDQAAVA